MKKRAVLRLASLAMFAAAVTFVLCCLCCPTLGHVIRIGPLRFGAEQRRVCYGIYAAVTLGLFLASFRQK